MKAVPNAGIVPTPDLVTPGTSYQIHPSKKLEIGERLAYMAATRDYGVKGIEAEAPEFESVDIDGDSAVLHFSNAADGFMPDRNIPGFEVAGEDRVFYPAQADVLCGNGCNAIKVTSDKVKDIKSVRFGFRNWQPTYVYNMRELPLVPFRTDSWDN